MENENIKTEEVKETVSEQDVKSETIKETFTKELPITKFTNHLYNQISRNISPVEIIMFAAAFATLPFIDLIAKSFGALGVATQILYAIIPAAAFGLGFWFSRNGIRPISMFLHSLAAIALIMAVVALLPMIPGVAAFITGAGTIAIGMPILAIVFIFVSARIQNTGASYIFATIATIIIFFSSIAQLIAIPCNNALISGSMNAQSICEKTPFIQGSLIPIAIYLIGYFSFKKSK